MTRTWTANEVLALARDYQSACILAAAADLNLFEAFAGKTLRADEVAGKLATNLRGTKILLDALTALELLEKAEGGYALSTGVGELLTRRGSGSVLAMAQHQANCLRRWAQLAVVVKTGAPAERRPSVRGEEADEAAFIGAMHDICGPLAPALVEELGALEFTHLLDLGGASGTWTMAFLSSYPRVKATLFDLPRVIPLARRRLADAGLAARVEFVAGDFYSDPLPGGADLVWISAIVHQNSRAQNRDLFRAVFEVLAGGGRVLIRDVLMDDARTSPAYGALFAVNMLVATESGGTFTFSELREELEAAGFVEVTVLRHDEAMDSVVSARKRQAQRSGHAAGHGPS